MTLIYCILALNLGVVIGAWWATRHRQECRGRECLFRLAAQQQEYELEALRHGVTYRPISKWVM